MTRIERIDADLFGFYPLARDALQTLRFRSRPSLFLTIQFAITRPACQFDHNLILAQRRTDNLPKSEVLQGTLDLMVLKVLDALGPQHGYGIARRIEQVSDQAIRLPSSASVLRW